MAALSAWIPYTNPMFRVASNGRVSTHAAENYAAVGH
jgi:hypothetical protein